jgi:hypothetical protein
LSSDGADTVDKANGFGDILTRANRGDGVKKQKRRRTCPQQLQDLIAVFMQNDTPPADVRERLAKKWDMTNREVQVSLMLESESLHN